MERDSLLRRVCQSVHGNNCRQWGREPAPHVCQVLEDATTGSLPRGQHHQSTVVQSLVWSHFLGQFIAVLWNTQHDPTIAQGAAFAFAVSEDLVSWSTAVALPLPEGLPAGQLAYPSLLDPVSGPAFDTVGQGPLLFFGLANPDGTGLRDHWDSLMRLPIQFSRAN